MFICPKKEDIIIQSPFICWKCSALAAEDEHCVFRNINTWKVYRNALKRNIPYVSYILYALMIHPHPECCLPLFQSFFGLVPHLFAQSSFSFALRVAESPLWNAENPQRLLTLVKTDGTQHSVKEHTVSWLLAKDVEGKWLCGCEHVHREKRKQLCVRKKEWPRRRVVCMW